MSEHDFQVAGTVVVPRKLTIPRARSVARFADRTTNPYVRLLNCYSSRQDRTEAVALAISATVPQRPFHDIRQTEPVLVTFRQDDDWYPIVESMRKDFPRVPHTNLTGPGEPRNLCLFDEPWDDVRINLTAPKLIARIMWWLGGTAAGTLHGDDQPLEPFIFDPRWDLIVPEDLLSNDALNEPEPFTCYTTGWSLRLVRPPAPPLTDAKKPQVASCLAMVVRCQPQQHSVIQATPLTLGDLHEFLVAAGVDLLAILRERIDRMIDKAEELGRIEGVSLVLLVSLPKTRSAGGIAESEELRAFAFRGPLGAIAEAVAKNPGDTDTDGPEDDHGDFELLPLNVRPGFSRALAAKVNGECGEISSRVIAVGVGALGSQVVVNLVRGGFGQWTLADHDLLQPHNLGRHALDGLAVGVPKAIGLARMLNGMIDGPPIAIAALTNVLRDRAPDNREVVDWKSGDIVLDMSASYAVTRYLSNNIKSPARRMSLFLNPPGTALTLLAEDRARKTPLDVLEMHYYLALAANAEPAELRSSPTTIRSGVDCRDVSTLIPQDLVGLHAGIGSRAIRRAVEMDEAQIVTWRVDESNYSVTATRIEVPEVRSRNRNGWRIFFDAKLEKKLRELRNAKLPNETGGVLIGGSDMSRRIIYVVDATEPPPDSRECPNGFLRGSQGLQEEVDAVQKATSGMLSYIGEWHSHTSGSVEPSRRDREVVKWVEETLEDEGQVGIVAILGSGKKFNIIPCTAMYP